MTDWQYCKKIMKRHGKGYYFATRFFPKEIRFATYAIYAWTRIPDDIVDIERNENKLDLWIKDWKQAENLGFSKNPEMNAMIKTVKNFNISKEYTESFLKSMKMDFYKKDYGNMLELKKYMYGSATSVGLMMMKIFGNFKTEAIPYATNLAEAMQLTNFLRDVREDFETKNRFYIPKDELQNFGLSLENIKNNKIPKEFIIFKIDQARNLFKKSREGIILLPKKVRFPILLSSYIYESILDEIEKQDYNVFIKRAKTNIFQKIIITFKTYIWYRKNM